MTCMFTKVQNISIQFPNVRVKRNWCTPTWFQKSWERHLAAGILRNDNLLGRKVYLSIAACLCHKARINSEGVYNEGKSPLPERFLPISFSSHWASFATPACSSSLLAHCCLLPAWPCPSPTTNNLSKRHICMHNGKRGVAAGSQPLGTSLCWLQGCCEFCFKLAVQWSKIWSCQSILPW